MSKQETPKVRPRPIDGRSGNEVYKTMKKHGYFEAVLGALVSADNTYTKEQCESSLELIDKMLEEIPLEEVNDRRIAEDCREIVYNELKKYETHK